MPFRVYSVFRRKGSKTNLPEFLSLKVYRFPLTLKAPVTTIVVCLSSACDFKSHFGKQFGPRSDCSFKSNHGPHCLPVCKNRFEKSARIFSRRHKQTTYMYSDVVFLVALRVKFSIRTVMVMTRHDRGTNTLLYSFTFYHSKRCTKVVFFFFFFCRSFIKVGENRRTRGKTT